MMAYVDEFGQITSTPPEERKTKPERKDKDQSSENKK
jgi:hypothetical protein